jgi:hypothetical protein
MLFAVAARRCHPPPLTRLPSRTPRQRDYQSAVGNGLTNSQCRRRGNFTLESSPSGDDVVLPFTTDI